MTEDPAMARLAVAAAVFLAMAGWEAARPRRARAVLRRRRWPPNLGIVLVSALLVRVLVPVSAVAAAWFATARGWGLLHVAALPSAAAVPVAVLLLDLAIYAQHVAFHVAPPLWRLHRVHHADLDLDVTTGVRFHPLEILLSALFRLAVVVALGAPPAAVAVFEVLLVAVPMFNHANVRLPLGVDRLLRAVIVTPDMHRVHHSVVPRETNSNYGFNLPWWDRVFRTYRAQPAAGHDGMTIGLEEFRDPRDLRLDRLLLQPLAGRPGPAARP